MAEGQRARLRPRLAVGTTLLLAPALLVGAWGLVPGWPAVPLAAIAAAPILAWLRRREAALGDARFSRRRFASWAVLLLLATLQLGRVGVFVVDPERHSLAALPQADRWALYHACFTGYTEAARLAFEGNANIYDSANYEAPDGRSRRLGLLYVDEYEYPPPFLPLPAALSAVTGHEVLRSKALFYGLQAVALVLVMVAAAARLPPSAAAAAWGLMPGVVAAFQTIVGMQYGNFQSGAFALAVAGMLAVTGARATLGASALAFAAASKLFPGLMVVLLVGARRYRAAAITMAWMVAFAALSLALFGPRPYVDFVTYQLPAISSGSGFAWAGKYPMLIPTNYGVSGLVLKAGALGLPGATFPRAMQVASLYGAVVVALTLFAAWRLRQGRVAETPQAGGPVLWLAVLNLASFRSPYVADAQATMGTLWLLSLLIAAGEWRGRRLAVAVVAWIAWALTFEGIAPQDHSMPLLIFTTALQVAALAFNAGVVLRALRPARIATPAGSPRSA